MIEPKLVRKLRGAARKAAGAKTVSFHGLTIIADPARVGGHMARWLYDGKYEAYEAEIVAATVKPGDRVLDCGGGMGVIAALAAKAAGPQGQVTVCEPNPDLADLIADNAAANGVHVTLRQGAVAATAGKATFHVADKFVASSLSGAGLAGQGHTFETEVFAFADLLAAHSPTFLIIDIEGAEADLFDEADLSGVRAVCLEVHPKAIGALAASRPIARLIDAGFAIDFERSRQDVFFLARP